MPVLVTASASSQQITATRSVPRTRSSHYRLRGFHSFTTTVCDDLPVLDRCELRDTDVSRSQFIAGLKTWPEHLNDVTYVFWSLSCVILYFCRAMLFISAAVAGMQCLSVCPSVCHFRELCQNERYLQKIFIIG